MEFCGRQPSARNFCGTGIVNVNKKFASTTWIALGIVSVFTPASTRISMIMTYLKYKNMRKAYPKYDRQPI
jgi:hypothetical protein